MPLLTALRYAVSKTGNRSRVALFRLLVLNASVSGLRIGRLTRARVARTLRAAPLYLRYRF